MMSDERQRIKHSRWLDRIRTAARRIFHLPLAQAVDTTGSQPSSGGEGSNKVGGDEGPRTADRLRPGSELAAAAAVKTTTSKSSDLAMSSGGEATTAPIPVLMGSSRVTASSSARPGNAHDVSLVSVSTAYPQSLWQEALEGLPDEDRPPFEQDSYGRIINEVLEKTKEQKEICERHASKFTWRGKQYHSREVVDKIIGWTETFIKVGDTVIQYDPGHAALPWAGVRFILQVSSAKYIIRQKYDLTLIGCGQSLPSHGNRPRGGRASNKHHGQNKRIRNPIFDRRC